MIGLLQSVLAAFTNPLPVSMAAAPTGAATSAKQDTGNTSLAAIAAALAGTIVTSVTGNVAVTGTFWQATQPVSATTLPLPSNAAQETGGNLASIVTNTGRIPTTPASEHTTAASPHSCRASDGSAFISVATEGTLSSLNGKVTACNTGAVTISVLPPSTFTAVGMGGAAVVTNGTHTVVGMGGTAIVTNGTHTVVGMGGAAIVVNGTMSVVGMNGAAIVANGTHTVVGMGGAAIVTNGTNTVVGMGGAAIVVNGTMSVVGMSGGAVAVTLPAAGSTFTAVGMGGAAIVTNGTHTVVGMGGAAIVTNGTHTVVGMGGAPIVVNGTMTVVGAAGAGIIINGSTISVVGMGGAGIAVNDTPPTLTKGSQGSTGYSTQDLKDAGRTRVIFTIDASTISTAEGLITMAQDKGGTTTNSALYSVTSAKTLRCTGGVITMTTTSTTVARTRVRFRENTGGSCANNSSVWFTADFGDVPGTLAAGDGYDYAIPFSIPDGVEFPASDSICITDTATTNTTGALSVTLWCFEY